MYRVLYMGGNPLAVELFTSGRSKEDEWEELEDFVNDGVKCEIVEDISDIDNVQLIDRDYN